MLCALLSCDPDFYTLRFSLFIFLVYSEVVYRFPLKCIHFLVCFFLVHVDFLGLQVTIGRDLSTLYSAAGGGVGGGCLLLYFLLGN